MLYRRRDHQKEHSDAGRRDISTQDSHDHGPRQHNEATIPDFTQQELRKAIKQLKTGRCKDTAGITAELLKAGGATLEQHLLKLYNDVIKPTQQAPEQWRRTTISVLHKSGDPALPQNYRPIAIIPVLYTN